VSCFIAVNDQTDYNAAIVYEPLPHTPARRYDREVMVDIKPISPQRILHLKVMRLQALQESPLAFGSKYAKESALSDMDWENRAMGFDGLRAAGYLTVEGGIGCGIVLGFVDENDATRAHLISMWVAPSRRRQGVGRSLVASVMEWARGRNVRDLFLIVTSINDSGSASISD
jgi:GNAT superfamily N-acetyltransferase